LALAPLFTRLREGQPSATTLAMVASFALRLDDARSALPLAEQAVKRNPQCVPCLDALADARRQLGDAPGAADALKLAIAAWPDETPPTALLRKLRTLEPVTSAR
jgi:hypothetical protein